MFFFLKKSFIALRASLSNVSPFDTVTKLEEFGSKIDFQEVFSFP